MSSISERFKIILKKKGITASEFSKIIDVQRSSISHIINGRNKPSLEIVTKVCRIYPDISLEWLINGNENKHTPTPFKESCTSFFFFYNLVLSIYSFLAYNWV